MTVRVHFYGSGNAFADGGRSHACIHITAPGVSLLLDCGGSSLPVIRRFVDPALISAIAITHLHGDHFGGIPFLLDQQKYAYRKEPFVIAGPPSLQARVKTVAAGYTMDLGSVGFPVSYVTLGPDEQEVAGTRIAAVPVRHVAAVEPHGLRVRVGDRLIAYSGDAAWTEDLVTLAKGADLFICEATNFAKSEEITNPVHVSYETLLAQRERLECKRMILTHLGSSTLAHLADLRIDYAVDGMLVEL